MQQYMKNHKGCFYHLLCTSLRWIEWLDFIMCGSKCSTVSSSCQWVEWFGDFTLKLEIKFLYLLPLIPVFQLTYTDSLINSAFSAYPLQHPFYRTQLLLLLKILEEFGPWRSEKEYDHAHIYMEAIQQMPGPNWGGSSGGVPQVVQISSWASPKFSQPELQERGYCRRILKH